MSIRQSETTTAWPNVIRRGTLTAILLFICVAALGCMPEHAARGRLDREDWDGMRLWYSQPAKVWTEALPVGNGRLGAMIFGDPAQERLR